MVYKIFGRPGCPYCIKSLELSSSKLKPVLYHDLSSTPDLKQKLIDTTGQTTVPFIFNEELFIGGFTEFKRHLEMDDIINVNYINDNDF